MAKADMKPELYATIEASLGNIDGVNKDGIYLTIDGTQYNIKVTTKMKPLQFEGMPEQVQLPTKKELMQQIGEMKITPEDRTLIIKGGK